MAGADISNSTFLRSIGMAAIAWPIPRLRGTDATFSISPCLLQFLSLGCVADGFDDWLAANGYTRVSRQNSIRKLPHVEAELRRRAIALLKSGTDLSTISHYLGHANLNTTNRYAKMDPEMKRKAIALVSWSNRFPAGRAHR